jgi:hypothetical protein
MGFPLTPSNGQIYSTPSGVRYKYNSVKDAWQKDTVTILPELNEPINQDAVDAIIQYQQDSDFNSPDPAFIILSSDADEALYTNKVFDGSSYRVTTFESEDFNNPKEFTGILSTTQFNVPQDYINSYVVDLNNVDEFTQPGYVTSTLTL